MKLGRIYNMATIYLSACEPIGVSKTAKQLWSDTYITIRFRPNHKINYGPTFISLSALERDIKHDEWAIDYYSNVTEKEHTDKMKSVFGEFAAVTKEDLINMVDDSKKSLTNLQRIKERLLTENYVIESIRDSRIPNIYIAAEYLNRQEVENAVRFWLNHKGHKFGKLKWKRQKFVITPA
jgi:hypothetical protein